MIIEKTSERVKLTTEETAVLKRARNILDLIQQEAETEELINAVTAIIDHWDDFIDEEGMYEIVFSTLGTTEIAVKLRF